VPLHADIYINDRKINSVHIGRVSGDTNPDTINDYLVVEGEEPFGRGWTLNGKSFSHRYGDGAEVCLLKGLKALGYDSAI
jgi:hypothetical protein